MPLKDRIGVIAKARNISPDAISMDTTFQELGIDSLEGLNVAFELEQEFNIEIPNEEVFAMTNVRQVVESLERVLTG